MSLFMTTDVVRLFWGRASGKDEFTKEPASPPQVTYPGSSWEPSWLTIVFKEKGLFYFDHIHEGRGNEGMATKKQFNVY
jgi:hypothetical protein